MPICFESCSGSPADVAEIEYIAALFMTCRDMNEPAAHQHQQQQQQQQLRSASNCTSSSIPHATNHTRRRSQQEGTVNAVDLCHYLMSRHGLKFSPSHVEQQILIHLAGSHRRRRYDKKRSAFQGDRSNIGDNDEECQQDEENVQKDGGNIHKQTVKATQNNKKGGKEEEENESGKKCWHGKIIAKKQKQTGEDNEEGDEKDHDEEEDDYRLSMDMVQLMSLLFIPELIRIRHEKENNQNDKKKRKKNKNDNEENKDEDDDNSSNDLMLVIKAALLSILELAGVEYGAELTMETLQQILIAHGEEHLFEGYDVDNNDEADGDDDNDGIALLKEMMASCCATDPSDKDGEAEADNTITLTEESMLRALTDDTVDYYHLHREDKISTHYQDALYDYPQHQLQHQIDAKQGKNKQDGAGWLGGKHDDEKKGDDDSSALKKNTALHQVYTASSSDNTADTFHSYWWNILAWATLVITFFAYFVHGFGNIDSTLPNVNCVDSTTEDEDITFGSYACQTLYAIIIWLQVLFRLALLGTIFLFFSTWGNSVWYAPTTQDDDGSGSLDYQSRKWHWWRTTMLRYSWAIFTNVVGMIIVVSATILSYSFEIRTHLFSTEKMEGDTKLSQYIGSLVMGCLLLAVQFCELVRLLSLSFRHKLAPSSALSSSIIGKASMAPIEHDDSTANKCCSVLKRFLHIFAASSARMECAVKHAARFKTQRILHNALACHIPSSLVDVLPGVTECKMQQNDRTTQHHESKACVAQEISTSTPSPDRHSSAFDNESPISAADSTGSSKKNALSILEIEPNKKAVSCSHVLLNFQYSQRYDFQEFGGILLTWKAMLWNQQTFLQEEGIWVPSRIVASQLGQWFVCFLVPGLYIYLAEKNFLDIQNIWDRMFGFTVGAFFAFFAATSVTLSYIPSAVSQILQFRTGVIGSLKDKMFQVYRFAPDETTMLFGCSFWGIIFTTGVTWSFVGIIAYALVWEDIRELVLLILANLLGILVTIALRIIILRCLRSSLYGGFYRRRPAIAVFISLALECWNLGLSGGYILMRTTKLMLITIFYLARIDTPLLAPGVGSLFSKINLDAHPIAFRKNLLIHESHRHPYIERLGLLFMLKLRHGPRFGSRASAAWRILFVLGLAPWMRSHRQASNGCPTSFRDATRSIPNRKQQQKQQGQDEHSMDQLLQENQMLQLENEMLRKRSEALTHMLQESMLLSMSQATNGNNRRLASGRRLSVPNMRQSSMLQMGATHERSSFNRNKSPKRASRLYISC